MDFDMSKRLCDCTLGEYLAAERTVGITTQWGMAVIGMAFTALAAYLWKRRKAKKEAKLLESLTAAPITQASTTATPTPPAQL